MCGCGSASVPQVSVQTIQPDNSISNSNITVTMQDSSCEYNVQTMIEWRDKLNSIPYNQRVNYNIYMGYINSGLAENHLICGALFPMFKSIGNYIAGL